MLPLAAGVGLGLLAIFVVIGAAVGLLEILVPVGVLVGLLGATQMFSLRASRAALSNIAGQPGAAAAVLGSLRRPWRVTPGIAFNRRQDLVHLAVGRPGVVLVAEGAPAGAAALLRQERKRVARVVGDVPIHDVSVGEGEGQLPLTRLQSHLVRLPNTIKKDDLGALENRLKALGGPNVPLPKGPMPRGRRGR